MPKKPRLYRLVLKGPAVPYAEAQRIRRLSTTAPAMLKDLRSGIEAVQFVLDNWSQGDLATAVNGLQTWADSARATITIATGDKA